MKNILLLILLLSSCKHEPEFYMYGKPYYTEEVCIKSEGRYVNEWHYGYSYRGKYEYYYGLHYVAVCLQSKIDTLEIK